MNRSGTHGRWAASRGSISLTGVIPLALVVAGLVLGITVHMAFMSLAVAGAFGPGALRQLGWLDDLDEFQRQAALKAGLRAYLVTGILLMAVVIADNWNRLSLGQERVPASAAVAVMLVVYYASYCLSFWDVSAAISRVLLAFGVLWFVFVLLSHAADPVVMIVEGVTVSGPFVAGAILCRRWPRTIGALLLALAVGSIFLFHLVPAGAANSADVLQRSFTFVLLPLPLMIAGVALVVDGSKRPSEDEGDQ